VTLTFPVSGFLFDNDGVLVDSLGPAGDAWDAWAAIYAPHFSFHRDIVHGQRASETIAGLVSPELFDEADADLARRELELVDGTVEIPGAVEFVSSLPADVWAVVTSGIRDLAYGRLAAAGIPTPSRLVAAEDVSRGKPDPEPYRRGAELLGIDPALLVVFEDAPAGVAAARAAGVGTIIGVGRGVLDAGATAVIEDLRSARFADGILTVTPLQ
jgi:sugar-phosphatase